jgi:hypothetical protein
VLGFDASAGTFAFMQVGIYLRLSIFGLRAFRAKLGTTYVSSKYFNPYFRRDFGPSFGDV